MTLLALDIADYMRRTTNRVNNIIFTISVIISCNIRSISSIKKVAKTTKDVSARMELDSHVDSIVAGENCCVMHYTSRKCDVSSYREYFTPIKNVQIMQVVTVYWSLYTGQTYILILNEALWMGDSTHHTLINPN